MTIDEQIEFIKKGAVDVIREADLRVKLEKSAKTGVPLRVKLGADPTAPDIHLGHTVVIRKLKAFQELGHTVIFLIGDFTGLIGDPTGKSATRPPLSPEEIAKNAETYKKQIFKLLDPEKTEIRFNSEWMNRFAAADFVKLSSRVTVKQILERDDFEKRMREEKPISLHELLYPLVQGYDSVALEADVELGGTDQKFNMLVGRNLQREYAQEPQIVITTPLLEGLDGVQKMSKSLGNYIGIDEAPGEMFGKIMSISDELMWRYYELLTDLTVDEINTLRFRCESGAENPRNIKVNLAKLIINDFHSAEEAFKAEEDFNSRFVKKEIPDDIEEKSVSEEKIGIVDLVLKVGLAQSKAEVKRLVQQGGVKINGEKVSDLQTEIALAEIESTILQVGKRHFVKIRRFNVESAVAKSIGYNPASKVLQIEFGSGDVYIYKDVPAEVYAGLMNADSHGKFFVEHIRNSIYEYEKLN
ncbi:MAG: tyrosyl-tRNA synthetase [Acidobacteria bacterium]|jgi:tyrosyl-tRNA synthetase|nr:tyrosyl-tRNA synthetase [Acidobacteriota bacterium]